MLHCSYWISHSNLGSSASEAVMHTRMICSSMPYHSMTLVSHSIKGYSQICWASGDCRAVLCHNGKAVALSRDQTADSEEERNRVQAAGVSVKWRVDSWRIGEAGIQVTRCVSWSAPSWGHNAVAAWCQLHCAYCDSSNLGSVLPVHAGPCVVNARQNIHSCERRVNARGSL